MIEKTVEIPLPLLLPEIQDACDHCIDRLNARLQAQRGILQTHLHLIMIRLIYASITILI